MAVGQLIERKNLFAAISALEYCANVLSADITLTVIGDGPLRDPLLERAARSCVNIEWLGQREPQQVAGIARDHHALLFPTLQDEWGLVVNEALSIGLPVLGSIGAESVVELIHDGVNGYVFDPADSSSLRNAVRQFLLMDQAMWDSMASNAARMGEAHVPSELAETIGAAVDCALGAVASPDGIRT